MLGFDFNKNLSLDYLAISIRSLVLSMVGMFIPIYILTLGYSFNELIIYYLFIMFFRMILVPFMAKLLPIIGIKYSIIIHFPLLVILYLLLFSSSTFGISIYWSLIPYVLSLVTFWPAFHTDFINSSDKKNRGHEVGFLWISNLGLRALGPIIAALILTFFSFSVLFMIVSIITLIAIIPMYKSDEIYPKSKFTFKRLYHKSNLKDSIFFFSEGIVSLSEVFIWPLFIYLLFKSFLIVGYAGSLIYASTLIVIFTASKYTDSNKKFKLMSYGSKLYALSWILKIYTKTSLLAYFFSAFSGISRTFFMTPYMSTFYDKSSKNALEHVTIRETFVGLGHFVLLLILLLTKSFVVLFALTSIMTLIQGKYR
jgi:MFS family permease